MTWATLPASGSVVSGELGSIAILVLYPSVCGPPVAARFVVRLVTRCLHGKRA